MPIFSLKKILSDIKNEETVRKISFVYYASVLNSFLYFILIPVAFFTNAQSDSYLITFLAILISLVPLITLRFKAPLYVSYLTFILLVFFELAGLQYYYGGFTPNITIFYPCLVPLGYILFGQKKGTLLTVFLGVIVTIFFLLDRNGFEFPVVPKDFSKDPVLSIYVTLLMSISLVGLSSYLFVTTFLKKSKNEKALLNNLHIAELENLESKSKQKEIQEIAEYRKRFLAHMSHEIRTPLNGIIGVLEILEMSELDSSQKELVNIVKNSSGSLQDILNKVLDLSKIEAGKVEVSKEAFNVKDIVLGRLNLFKSSAIKKGLSITHSGFDKSPSTMIGDKNLIAQILSNLIGNAVKFTDKGEICVSYAASNNAYKIEVHDTGKGISEAQINELFKEYHQLDNQFSNIKGTGLGLLISKELVKIQNGDIGAYINKEGGTTFWFELPLLTAKTNTIKKMSTSIDNPSKIVSDLNILVVDDKKVNLTVAKLMLEKLGNKVALLQSGINIESRIEKEDFDLILLDINMPDLSGVEVLKNIRSSFPDLKSQIFALTANSMEGDKEKYLKLGFDGYMAKPLTLDKINQDLSQFI